MIYRIGLLLPRSTDYPSLGFDLADGLRSSLIAQERDSIQIISENIGFGEDQSLNYAKAEKLILQDDVSLIIAYCNITNAEPLYGLAEATQRPFIFLDAGMQQPHVPASSSCYHISLQGLHACRMAGFLAGETGKTLMATSFYDGGYRGPWSYARGVEESGGSVCGNYVSGYKVAEFNIDGYMALLASSGADSVSACFSSYLAGLFMKALKEKQPAATARPFYCSPFMAEEQLLSKCEFPGGTFYTVVPWATSISNNEQQAFIKAIRAHKEKEATLFHLLGWEAGLATAHLMQGQARSLAGFSYNSPRGRVTIHPDTNTTYAPLYKGMIIADHDNKCRLCITGTIPVTADEHLQVMLDRPEGVSSGWKNNYLCI